MHVSTGRECHLTAADESGKCEMIHPPDNGTPSPINSSHVDSEDDYVNLQTIPVAIDFPYMYDRGARGHGVKGQLWVKTHGSCDRSVR